ncbi:MAG: hypothetical protein ACVCEJ_08715 [Candidatus Izemoplasmataceae bacterium]
MKKIFVIIVGCLVFLLMGILITINLRSVYFVDGSTGETTKLTSIWLKQNEIEIKDKWFDSFEQKTVSGIIYIEDSKEYALISYTYTRLEPKDDDLGDLYYSKLSRVKSVNWIGKDVNENLKFTVLNEQRHSIAVGTFSGTSYDETEYGNGVYSIPVYNDSGDLHYYLQFPTYSLAGISEGFNDDTPCYILQDVIFIEVSLTNHDEITFLLPIDFMGGLMSEDVLDSDHYYIDYNGHEIIFEAFIDRIE